APVVATSSAAAVRTEPKREPEFPVPGATMVTVDQLLTVLRKSTSIEQRQWAADNLGNLNRQDHPHVPELLLKAAREDSAPPVRAASVRSLMKLGVYTASARAVFQALKNDADPRVRLEAEAALRNLGPNQTESSSPPTFPTRTITPVGSR